MVAGKRGLADKGGAGLGDDGGVRAEHRPVENGLHGGNGGVGIAHRGPVDDAAFDDERRLRAEGLAGPEDEVGEFAGRDATDFGGDAVGDCRVNRQLGEVAEDALVVIAG